MILFLAIGAAAEKEKEEKGKLYVIGMGPAGPDLTASGALSIVKNADVYLTSPGFPKRFYRFSEYIDPEKVAFDPWKPFMDKEVRQSQAPLPANNHWKRSRRPDALRALWRRDFLHWTDICSRQRKS